MFVLAYTMHMMFATRPNSQYAQCDVISPNSKHMYMWDSWLHKFTMKDLPNNILVRVPRILLFSDSFEEVCVGRVPTLIVSYTKFRQICTFIYVDFERFWWQCLLTHQLVENAGTMLYGLVHKTSCTWKRTISAHHSFRKQRFSGQEQMSPYRFNEYIAVGNVSLVVSTRFRQGWKWL